MIVLLVRCLFFAFLLMGTMMLLVGCSSPAPRWEMYRFSPDGKELRKVRIPSYCELHPQAMGCK